MPEKEVSAKPLKELMEIILDEAKQEKKVKIGAKLSTKNHAEIVECLRQNKDVLS